MGKRKLSLVVHGLCRDLLLMNTLRTRDVQTPGATNGIPTKKAIIPHPSIKVKTFMLQMVVFCKE
jgi:hypothetical protein